MSRLVNLNRPVEISIYSDGSNAAALHLTKEDLERVLEALVSLRNADEEELVIRGPRGTLRIMSSHRDFGEASFKDTSLPTCRLSLRQLSYIESFLEEYKRVGMAPVQHIDVEIDDVDSEVSALLVVQAEDFKPPMEAKEAERILRTWDD